MDRKCSVIIRGTGPGRQGMRNAPSRPYYEKRVSTLPSRALQSEPLRVTTSSPRNGGVNVVSLAQIPSRGSGAGGDGPRPDSASRRPAYATIVSLRLRNQRACRECTALVGARAHLRSRDWAAVRISLFEMDSAFIGMAGISDEFSPKPIKREVDGLRVANRLLRSCSQSRTAGVSFP